MSIPPSNDRRDFTVAAVTPGSVDRETRSGGGTVEVPIILLAALAAADTSVETFIERLTTGSIWQDGAIRSTDRTIAIEASLFHDGLRAVVQIGKTTWYHHPADVIHAWGVVLPATVMALRDVPLATILRHPLLDPLPVHVRALRDLNAKRPDLGPSIHLAVPTIGVSGSLDKHRPGPAFAAPSRES